MTRGMDYAHVTRPIPGLLLIRYTRKLDAIATIEPLEVVILIAKFLPDDKHRDDKNSARNCFSSSS